jgi:hypothetical protein
METQQVQDLRRPFQSIRPDHGKSLPASLFQREERFFDGIGT